MVWGNMRKDKVKSGIFFISNSEKFKERIKSCAKGLSDYI